MELNEAIVIPVLIAFVELFKGLGLPKKYAALVTLALSVLLGIFYLEPGNIKSGVLKGIIYGLSASGLYSGTKNTVEQMRMRNR